MNEAAEQVNVLEPDEIVQLVKLLASPFAPKSLTLAPPVLKVLVAVEATTMQVLSDGGQLGFNV